LALSLPAKADADASKNSTIRLATSVLRCIVVSLFSQCLNSDGNVRRFGSRLYMPALLQLGDCLGLCPTHKMVTANGA
jgi:hypothetical protein